MSEGDNLQDAVVEQDEPEVSGRTGIPTVLCVILMAMTFIIGVTASKANISVFGAGSEIVQLTAAEKVSVQSLAERRQDLQIKRSAYQAAVIAQTNRFNEIENDINNDAQKMCFSLKKSHKLAPNSNYQLDEWNGELRKQ